GWSWTFLHRALPCAIAHKAFSLTLMSLGRISDIHNISLFFTIFAKSFPVTEYFIPYPELSATLSH
ncbi:MAG: hypothetical protein LBN93_09430, partial [Candidatus Symbiothrix sp.]|nr:hypothetical protein [Candidatus Symbiothrix sp.]